ncbi:hypothetical protein D1007_17171 [Hordeum vulgare]|nr:hypothetical protein D1007_17171 [Hordeum vulgare]
MAKADKYATADSVMRIKVSATVKAIPPPATTRPAGDNRGGQNNKRKADQQDLRPGSKQVANIEEEQPTAQADAQRQRTDKNTWQPKVTFEQMLDAPCKIHTGAKPATHTLRQCSFSQLLARGEGLPAPSGPAPRAPDPSPPPPNDVCLHD